MSTKKVVLIGIMISVAFVLSYVEAVVPISLGVPGIKMGLANIAVILCLYSFSIKETVFVSLVRILLVGLTFGNLSMMLYSISGATLSLIVMITLKWTDKFSVYGVSVAGGVFHNIGQIVVAIIILQTSLLMYYLPFLLISGIVSGFIVGFLGANITNKIAVLLKN